MEFQIDPARSYRVEVSGWDASENFFVEKTTLNWARDEKKNVHLRSVLREGAVVFVRLMQTLTNTNNFPVAYQAQRIGPRNAEGLALIHLSQLRPRPTYRQDIENLTRPIRVA
ncbi:MAG TPA: hypothetical protein VLY23_14335 [Candidatus Acidoferrum sp.]|nr:hypothetical protein [Candidatus Acidoferrum sp.]